MPVRAALVAAGLLAASGAWAAGAKPAAPSAAHPPASNGTVLRNEQDWKAWVKDQVAELDRPHAEPADPDPFAFSTFRGVRPEPMGEQTIINGAKMKIASLVVDEPPDVVEAEYLRVYTAARVPALRGMVPNTRGVRYISFRPQGSRNLKTITLVPRGRGTVVLASIGDPSRMLEHRGDLPEGVPLPPNATSAASIAQVEAGARSHTSSYVVRGATADEVRTFYRDELARQGFTGKRGEGEVDTYERGEVLLSVSASPASEPGAITLSLVWMD